MSLPKIKHITFTETIPSTHREVTLRPFTVKEEKIVLLVQNSDNPRDVIQAISQLLNNCIVEGDTYSVLPAIDISKLATFDVEYLFIKLRAKSVGEIIDISVSAVPDDIYEGMSTPTEEILMTGQVNLDDVKIVFAPNHQKKFMINDQYGVIMRYPTFADSADAIAYNGDTDQHDMMFNMFVSCIEAIYDQDTVYDEFTQDEMIEFVESLDLKSIEKISEFFESIPSLKHTVVVTSEDGKHSKTIELEGISDFFT